MALMKRLLIDAQAKFRRMVDENKQLASRIDGEIQSAQDQVNNLRDELTETNKRLDEHINNRPDAKPSSSEMTNNTGPLNPSDSPLKTNSTSSSSSSYPPKTDQDNPDRLFYTNNDGENSEVSVNKTPSTNPFTDSIVSSTDKMTSKLDFFSHAKSLDFFSSKLSDSTSFFSSSFSDSTNKNNSDGTKKDKLEYFGNSDKLFDNLAKNENFSTDSFTSKIFGTSDGGGKGSSGGGSSGGSDIKSEDFVLTSNLKLNFLTKSPDDSKKSASGKNTGAVPKRNSRSNSGSSNKSNDISEGNSELGKLGKNDSQTDVEQFVRPSSPLPGTTKDGEQSCKISHQKSTSWEGNHTATLSRLKLENERLHREVENLQRQLTAKRKSGGANSSSDTAGSPSGEDSPETRSRIQELEEELMHAKEALTALKLDRKRLKAEKFDLLNQMKQLYGTLEDKEKELRDFIRNYEQRMRESESSLQQLSTEREERERERWSLLRHARDEAERSLSLAAQLAAKDAQIQQLQENLEEARRQTSGTCLSDQESLASMSISRINGSTGGMTPTSGPPVPLSLGGLLPGDRGSCSADSGVRGSSDRESGGATSGGGNLSDSTTDGTPTITLEQGQANARLDMDSVSVSSSVNPSHVYQSVSTPKDCSPSLSPLNATTFSRSIDNSTLSRSVEQLSSPMEEPRRKSHHSRLTGRGGAWGSISRVFTRSRHRKVSSPSSQEESTENYRSWSPLTEEGYAEKLRLLREAATIPMERWRAPAVLAWLEIALGMPQYGPRCAENIKSGKVLLELSDLELECGLGITHPMHRKKLRLAIEEHRHPALVRYPCIAQLGHTWVSSEWLPDLGLAQYAENFATNMVDARMLDHLSKKELEKFLGVTRKFHQASIVHGIHLLRMMKYDRQALAVRRHQCESVDADPLVWTNQRFIKWARNIDLCEYSDNLKDSGVHGALVVLEPSFNGDTMATALGIPPAKNIIRRHLAAELEALILPARASFEHLLARSQRRAEAFPGGGSLGRSLSRSLTGGLSDHRDKPTLKEIQENDAKTLSTDDTPRSSLRVSSVCYN